MIELFRYIEQDFVVPPDQENSINVEDESDFQDELRTIIQQTEGSAGIKAAASGFIRNHFANRAESPINLKQQLLEFHSRLLELKTIDEDSIPGLTNIFFDSTAADIAALPEFQSDKQLLNDSIIAVKLVTAYDIVNASDLVKARQAVDFIQQLARGSISITTKQELNALLLRSIRIPAIFFRPANITNQQKPPSDTGKTYEERRIQSLLKKQSDLQTTYDSLMALRTDELKMTELKEHRENVNSDYKATAQVKDSKEELAVNSLPSELTLRSETVNNLGDSVRQTLHESGINLATTPLIRIVDIIKKNWNAVSKEVMPYAIPNAAKVYQVGIHTFAVQEPLAPTTISNSANVNVDLADQDIAFDFSAGSAADAPDFSFAITKPIGIGNLQIVRQELMGYEAGEISHIENVMESELFRRSTRRSETNELTTIQETETVQMEERDLQSTERNELARETQKEAGSQKTGSQDQTTTSDYGKLVENNKTNYARTVTDRAVNSLTQRTRSERIEREKKTYTERTVHEFDNRKTGATKIRGIYQWVDKKIRNRIMNYGKRLLYDVVLPEPAAFLIESLKKAQQPESFQLTKPVYPSALYPNMLNASSYMWYAKTYGVTGTVTPPPDEFITVTHPETQDVSKEIKSFGASVFGIYMAAFNISIPVNYEAFSGYIQRVNPAATAVTNILFEFFVGKDHFFSVKWNDDLRITFNMNGETGDLPVTFRTFDKVVQFSFAIGIVCRRTNKVYEQWQLKTHAAIMEGYRRQNAEYLDQLSKLQASIRTQMALSVNYAHNPSIEREELKKVFISLLMSEHFLQVFLPTPIPTLLPPNPTYYKNWGRMVAFFERAFEWENIMYTYYPYFWGRNQRWGELILIQDINPQFEQFLKAGAARVVVPVRPGYESAMAHYHETGDIWMGKEMPDMFSDMYVSIIEEIKARNFELEEEVFVAQWDVKLPTTLVMLKEDDTLP